MRVTNIEMEVSSLIGKIEISWSSYDGSVKEYILMKKRASIPKRLYDGNLVYRGNETSFSDTDIKNGELYYYRLFIVTDTQVLTDTKCIIKAIAFNSNTYSEAIYKQVPSRVRYEDFKLKQDYPLKRFMSLLSFPFDKIDTFSEVMVNQLDIDNCDEAFLQYHAKWKSILYNENFGTDINRLLIKTMGEIEPYAGTKVGLTYLLQRIFKSNVKIEIVDAVAITLVNIYIDASSEWLLNYESDINKIIRGFLALRTKYKLIVNMVYNEVYDGVEENEIDSISIIDNVKEFYNKYTYRTNRFNNILNSNFDTYSTRDNHVKEKFFDNIIFLPENDDYRSIAENLFYIEGQIARTNNFAYLTNNTMRTAFTRKMLDETTARVKAYALTDRVRTVADIAHDKASIMDIDVAYTTLKNANTTNSSVITNNPNSTARVITDTFINHVIGNTNDNYKSDEELAFFNEDKVFTTTNNSSDVKTIFNNKICDETVRVSVKNYTDDITEKSYLDNDIVKPIETTEDYAHVSYKEEMESLTNHEKVNTTKTAFDTYSHNVIDNKSDTYFIDKHSDEQNIESVTNMFDDVMNKSMLDSDNVKSLETSSEDILVTFREDMAKKTNSSYPISTVKTTADKFIDKKGE